jgi:hypothetical protein
MKPIDDTYVNRTPKSILCSQKILSDMKSDCGYHDDDEDNLVIDPSVSLDCSKKILLSEASEEFPRVPQSIIDLDETEKDQSMTQEDVEKLVPQIDQVMNVEKIDD